MSWEEVLSWIWLALFAGALFVVGGWLVYALAQVKTKNDEAKEARIKQIEAALRTLRRTLREHDIEV